MDATDLAELVRSGEASPAELIQTAIERIEALNGELNAVIHPLFEKALATEPADGPFRGVPFLLKDLACHCAGDPHPRGHGLPEADSAGSSEEDTWLARRFREAGLRAPRARRTRPSSGSCRPPSPTAYGPARNPWNTTHSTGGSSGGSAAAVAVGMVPIAHASDGGGSIRIPASAAGSSGLKPSRGRVSLAPEFGDFMSGLTTELVVSRSVRDAAAVLEWVADPPPGEPYYAPDRARPYTEEVGADPGPPARRPDDAPAGRPVREPIRTAWPPPRRRRGCSSRSVTTVEPSYPDALDDEGYIEKFLVRWTSGVDYGLRYWERKTGQSIGPDDVEPLTWALAEQGRAHSAAATTWRRWSTRRRSAARGAELVGRARSPAHADDGATARSDRRDRERRRGRSR